MLEIYVNKPNVTEIRPTYKPNRKYSIAISTSPAQFDLFYFGLCGDELGFGAYFASGTYSVFLNYRTLNVNKSIIKYNWEVLNGFWFYFIHIECAYRLNVLTCLNSNSF